MPVLGYTHNRSVYPPHLEPAAATKSMFQILPPVIRKAIKWFLTFIRADKVGTTPSSVLHSLPGREFQPDKTGKTNMHPNLQALTQLPPPSERTIHGDIPIYYLQVPAHKVREPDPTNTPVYV